MADARKRILYTLPATLPVYPSVTPYFDPTLFSFDEKFPGVIERAKVMDSPLKFFSRKTERLVFELNLEPFKNGNVITLFHPSDPFVISFEKNLSDGLLIFHMPQPALL
uniref:MSP domain-containing protein n=1 Tax=Steinernema glaseri TaxID=37863 RepID=A0A1I7Y7H3_9BILA